MIRVLLVLIAAFAAVAVFRWLSQRVRWSGISPDKQARIRVDEAQRAGPACAARGR